MKKSAELREQKLLVVEQMNKLHDQAEKEDRSFNEAEQSKYNDLKNQVREFDKRIATAQEREYQELEIAQSRAISLTDKEKRELKDYSIIKAINEHMNGNLSGLEKEMHEEAVSEARASGQSIHGFGIPLLIVRGIEQRTEPTPHEASATDEGSKLVPTMKTGFVDGLWPDLVVETLGATVWRGLSGSISVPRVVTGLAAAWADETGDAEDTNATFDEVNYTPNRLAAFTQVSKRLLIQSSIDIEAWIRRTITRAVAEKLEKDIIDGDGSPIAGLLGLTNTVSVAHGTNGGAPTWTKVVEFEAGVSDNDALKGRLAYLTNSKVRAKLKTVSKDSGSGMFLWEPNNLLNGYPVGVTSLVPSDKTKSSGNNLSCMIFGNWEDYAIAQWGGFDLTVDQYTKAKKGMVEIVINSFWDAKPLQPKSFAQSVDIATA